MPSWKKVILSGSDATLNSLYVTTNVTASSFTGSFTGSFLGTSSFASQALSSSFATTASYASTALAVQIEDDPFNLNPNYIVFSAGTGSQSLKTDVGALSWEPGANVLDVKGLLIVSGNIVSTGVVDSDDVQIDGWGSISASLASISTTGSSQTLQQVTTNGNITNTSIILTGSAANSLQIVNSGGDIPFISVSGSVVGPTPGRLVDVIYNAISVTANATTTISQLPAPKVAGFTFDYIAYVSGNVLQAGRAGVVKGILRNTETGVVTKAFQINETTTLDLIDQGEGTAGLQFNIIQDTNGTSNQLVAITDGTWPYTINYTLTIYYNPDFS
jgi:hypothetical protein